MADDMSLGQASTKRLIGSVRERDLFGRELVTITDSGTAEIRL